MSFDLNEVRRLEVMGGAVEAKYWRLVSNRDGSAHESPSARELGEFMKAFEQDPNKAAEIARNEAVAAAEAAALAARGSG
jgi:hypothetical protein